MTAILHAGHYVGWITTNFWQNLFEEIPEGSDAIEPFDADELRRLLDHPTFSEGHRSIQKKAFGELQFWIPILFLTTGMITSEILRLAPECIAPHPDKPHVKCFIITNAFGRGTKTVQRKRYLPIHKAIDITALETLARERKSEGKSYLFPIMDEYETDTEVSNMFSAYFSDLLRNKIGIKDKKKRLYSLRHCFKDFLRVAGASDSQQDQLMGHSEAGMGKRYGTKSKPRPVDIVALNKKVQAIDMAFLKDVVWPK